MTKFFLVLVLIFSPFTQEGKWTKIKVGENITMSLPEDFYEMTPQDIAQRYPSVRRPLGAYTNSQRLADISIKISATQWRSTDTPIAKDFFKSSVMNLYDRVDFTKEVIETIDGKDFIIFEFDSRINPEESLENRQAVRKYNYVMYLIKDMQTYVFTFQCPVQIKDQWTEKAAAIMQSVKVK
ncbi:hypothetical protein [Fulvivirga sedimenti]|uniref:Uncharacterized protein n=1 Tax=Fulvivirga sedimenti TaxID=2879465 RepID=A0A9X1HWI0_9BACT|nr:hypothetical protein [Fulvivirga sedimenti]MCA6079131.1 hypothetical protein [Fulvivirga sedimenti]